MSNMAIRVSGLGKLFRLGAPVRYRTLRETLTESAAASVRFMRGGCRRKTPVQTFWALKDVSFEVQEGEVIGVIGTNGAGKSTLLKILSRITEPTEGEAAIRGRLASLLEVGTGFHPELTGRENIFLNGAILGMKKSEILRRFDEIVSFAEVEQFIDTPVKRYSSGMYVRLAFSVAAHLDPEVMIVDEVLAVGDQRFQEKCLSRMGQFGKQGRTVLFVSHSMPSIQRLCSRVIILEGGRIRMDAPKDAAVAEYLSSGQSSTYSGASSDSEPVISRASVVERERSFLLSVDFRSPFPLTPPVLGFVIYDPVGNPVYGTNTRVEPPVARMPSARSGRIEVAVPTAHFRPNRYLISLWLGDAYSDYCELPKILQMTARGAHLTVSSHVVGSMRLPLKWRFRTIAATVDEPVAATQ